MPSLSASTRQARFDKRVVPDGDCLIWTGALNPAGYGWFSWSTGRPKLAHRAAWILAGRTLTDGYDLHHKCHTPACVNVDHLEEVTPSANRTLALKSGPAGMCGAGLHPWVPENWYHRASGPICKPCHLERQRRYDRGRRK